MLNRRFIEESTEKYRATAEAQAQQYVMKENVVSLILAAYQSGLMDGFAESVRTYGHDKE